MTSYEVVSLVFDSRSVTATDVLEGLTMRSHGKV